MVFSLAFKKIYIWIEAYICEFVYWRCSWHCLNFSAIYFSLTDKRLIETYIYITGVPFPKNFMSVAKTILKRLFRVYAHIYHQHFDSVMQLQEEAHLNTSFKHFIFFVQVS